MTRRFCLKCIAPHKGVIDDGAFSIASLRELEGWDAVMGLAFENLVTNNYWHLLPHFHLEGLAITSAGPYLRRAAKGPRGRPGCQIDLMIQTRRTICIVESAWGGTLIQPWISEATFAAELETAPLEAIAFAKAATGEESKARMEELRRGHCPQEGRPFFAVERRLLPHAASAILSPVPLHERPPPGGAVARKGDRGRARTLFNFSTGASPT